MTADLEFDGLPEELDPEFQRAVNFITPPDDASRDPIPTQSDTDEQKRHAPYVSFGDGTITATSGAFGTILRISQFVDRPDFESKMLALDYPDAPAPFCIVARADDLVNQAQSNRTGFGLRIANIGADGAEGLTTPSLTFLGDRWPGIRYRVDDALDVRVGLVCRDHMVVQRTRITNQSSFRQTLGLQFDPRVLMRDLDYTTARDDVPSQYLTGPHGRSLVLMEQRQTLADTRRKRLCVVVGLFKNGIDQELKDAFHWYEETIATAMTLLRSMYESHV